MFFFSNSPVVVFVGVDPPLEGLGGPQGELHKVLVARLRNYNRHGTIKKNTICRYKTRNVSFITVDAVGLPRLPLVVVVPVRPLEERLEKNRKSLIYGKRMV